MALASYSDLKAAIARWMRRSDLTDVIPDFIALAEASMNRELRTSLQMVRQAYVIGAETVDKPDRFRQLRSLRLTDAPISEILEWSIEEMNEAKAQPGQITGYPRRYCAVGTRFEFWPVPTSTYNAVITFQTGFEALSDDNPSNWILADHPDAYLAGALAEACAFVKDNDRAATWVNQFDRVIGEIQYALRTTYDRKLRVDTALTARSRYFGGLFAGATPSDNPTDEGGGYDFSTPADSFNL